MWYTNSKKSHYGILIQNSPPCGILIKNSPTMWLVDVQVCVHHGDIHGIWDEEHSETGHTPSEGCVACGVEGSQALHGSYYLQHQV